MRKALIVAGTEFSNSIRGKVFVISLLAMPVIWAGAIAVQKIAMDRADMGEHRFAVIDGTGVLAEPIQKAAAAWNTASSSPDGSRKGPAFVPVPHAKAVITDAERLELSQQVRGEKLFAFVEIPPGVFDPDEPARIRYYSDHPSYETLPRWLKSTISAEVVSQRFREAAVDRATVEKLTTPVGMEEMGLVRKAAGGETASAEQVDKFRAVGVPAVLMFLVFLPVMFITPQLINSVLEEKMSRISEVLLGSLKPFELMAGKLMGAGAVSLVLAFTYMGGAYGAAVYFGYANAVSGLLLVEFAVFLALAMLLFGSLYLAVGSACSTLKDAQSLATPVGLISVMPMMLLGAIMKSPDGPLSVALSFFPFTTPYLMLLRAASNPPAPLWQVALSVLTTGVTTIAVVWAAARIFRTGLLMYGKAPTFGELIKWVRA